MKYLSIAIALLFPLAAIGQAPDSLEPPPPGLSDLLEGDGADSLLKMMNTEMLRQAQDAKSKQDRGRSFTPDPGKPRSPSLDYKSITGPDTDHDKMMEELRKRGLIPNPDVAERNPQPDLWRGVDPERRLHHARQRLDHHECDEALMESTHILQMEDIEEEILKEAISVRIQALFLCQDYEECVNNFLHFRDYYPEDPLVAETLQNLEKESGVDVYQDRVKKKPLDSEAQIDLLRMYNRYQWESLGLRFFEENFKEPNAVVCESLGKLYYERKDFRKLAAIAERAQKLDPKNSKHLYNQAVGLYHLRDPLSLDRARELLTTARDISKDPAERERINWYLARLPKE